jgi:alpha-tubulin suppressor-like RCC1 family protein
MATRLQATGRNNFGQIGDGTTVDVLSPKIIGGSNWKAVAGGFYHSLGIKADGTLWAWGNNGSGRLGDGTTLEQDLAVQVGTATWATVSAGSDHSLGIQANGTLWAWGANATSQLGRGSGHASTAVPVQIGTATWLAVYAGTGYSLGIRSNNTLWAWGANTVGQVGDGSGTEVVAPVQIGTAAWKALSAGRNFAFGIQTDNTLWAWGDNTNGQLGDGTTTGRFAPAQLGTATWNSVSAGVDHTLAIQAGGTLWSWGNNGSGQLGDGTTTSRLAPAQVGTATWSSIAAAFASSYAIQANSTLWSWGYNAYGELGDGTIAGHLQPAQVGATLWNVVASTGFHTLLLDTYTIVVTVVTVDTPDTANAAGTTASRQSTNIVSADAAAVQSATRITSKLRPSLTDTAALATTPTYDVVQWLHERADALNPLSLTATTHDALADNAQVNAVLQSLLYGLIVESASGHDSWFLGAGVRVIEAITALGIFQTQAIAIQVVAELIAAIDLGDHAKLADFADAMQASSSVTVLVTATAAILEAALLGATADSYLVVIHDSIDSAAASGAVTAQQVLNTLLADGAAMFVRVFAAGEVFTGWVLGTQPSIQPGRVPTLPVSEYQGLGFNSLAKIGGRYFAADESGIVELTGETDGARDIATYVQSGLLDFGTEQEKGMTYAYLATSLDGRVALGVRTANKRKAETHWYAVAVSEEGVENVRLKVGHGLKSRYYRLEVASERMSTFEAITVLPVVLERRI